MPRHETDANQLPSGLKPTFHLLVWSRRAGFGPATLTLARWWFPSLRPVLLPPSWIGPRYQGRSHGISRLYKDPGHPDCLAAAHIGVDVISYHDRPGRLGTQINNADIKNSADGLPTIGISVSSCCFKADDECPHVQGQSVGSLKASIAMQADHRHAAESKLENPVQFPIANTRTRSAQ